jgi:hypothetical protein
VVRVKLAAGGDAARSGAGRTQQQRRGERTPGRPEAPGCGAGRSARTDGSELGLGRGGLLGWDNRGSPL